MRFGENMTTQAAHNLVEVLQRENDVVRIVEPVNREILYWPGAGEEGADAPCSSCNAIWGRDDRCATCSSLEAIRLMQRTFKMELSDKRAFWVQSRPMVFDGVPCVMEIVNDVTDGLLVEGGDRGSVQGLIDSLNGLLLTDALTSLLNRRFLDEFNARMPELREAGTRVNIAMIDLDDMKVINDTYGHPAGDAVLKDIAGFLKLNFGTHARFDRQQYAVRFGGDEFIVIDLGSDFRDFQRVVLEHYAHMRRVCYIDGQEIPFSLSCGFASSDEAGWDWNAILNAADQCMYSEKHTRIRR